MWALISRPKQVLIMVVLTTIVLLSLEGLNEWWTGQPTSLLKWASIAATIISGGIVAGANLVWRWIWRRIPQLNRWFFPDLNGEWKGTLQTTWRDPETGQVPGPIDATVTIRQTLFTTHVRMRTGESESWATRVISEADPAADQYRLWYSYNNKPRAEVSHRSCRHEGAAWLEVSLDDNPDRLTGQYYTDRRTTGDIELRRVSSAIPVLQR
ncbi:hypothetical protein HPT29_002260 [Microvirga terrae]|uniref:CD-NTase-associated protein 15 domain-containing protein n=1 Tax=Microvirga terrae TaxID=2740529 RepID=A0ABY5RT85_9HYPH|nr:hypothetical protein [Microvirga terrae]UVF19997.1 hypothetical protein HPT29_002260 [Microvirga terrae]